MSDFLAAVCGSLVPLPSFGLSAPEQEAVLDEVAGFVQGQLDSLPLLARLIFRGGITAFRLWVRLKFRTGFLSLDPSQRRAAVKAWFWSSNFLGVQLFRAVRSTALLAFYEHPRIRAVLESGPAGEARAGEGPC